MGITTLAATGPRTNVYAARVAPRPRKPVAPAVSSMDLPNRAGQKGPVPMRGIVNALAPKGAR